MNPETYKDYHDDCYKEYAKYDVDKLCKDWFEETIDMANRYRDKQTNNTTTNDQSAEIKRLRDLVKRAWEDGYITAGADEFEVVQTPFEDTDIAKELHNDES